MIAIGDRDLQSPCQIGGDEKVSCFQAHNFRPRNEAGMVGRHHAREQGSVIKNISNAPVSPGCARRFEIASFNARDNARRAIRLPRRSTNMGATARAVASNLLPRGRDQPASNTRQDRIDRPAPAPRTGATHMSILKKSVLSALILGASLGVASAQQSTRQIVVEKATTVAAAPANIAEAANTANAIEPKTAEAAAPVTVAPAPGPAVGAVAPAPALVIDKPVLVPIKRAHRYADSYGYAPAPRYNANYGENCHGGGRARYGHRGY